MLRIFHDLPSPREATRGHLWIPQVSVRNHTGDQTPSAGGEEEVMATRVAPNC